MSNYNLTNQEISSSFQQVMQHDKPTGLIYDGTGSLIENLSVTSSEATHAISASHALNSDNSISASYAVSASHAVNADIAIDALHADSVQFPVIAKETISKGDPVYVSGYNNGEGKPEVLKADASDSSKMPVVGLALVDAVNNDHIFIISAGSFPNVDTSTGLTTPAVGDTLYVASGGGYTNVKPTGTNLIQNIGVIGRVQQTSGEIVVSAIQRTNDLPNIADGYIWEGDSNGVPQAVLPSSILPGGTVSGSSQITDGSGILSSSTDTFTPYSQSVDARIKVLVASGSGADWNVNLTNIPVGLVSGSSQLTSSYDTRYILSGSGIVPAGTISGSQQVIDSLPTGVVSGSAQTIANLPTGTVSGSTQITDGSTILSGSFESKLPSGTVSGSTQITDGSGLLSSSNETFAVYSASVDSRIISSTIDTGSFATTGSNTFNGTQTLNPGHSLTLLGGNVQVTGSVDALGGLVSKQNMEVVNPSGTPYIRIGNTTKQYQFAGSEIYTNRTLNPGNVYAGFTVLDTGNSMNGGININTYTGIDGSTPVFQLFGGGGSGGNGQTILAAKDDSTVQFFKYNYFNNTTEFNNNIICNGPSEFRQNMVVSASIDTSGSVEAAVGKFDGVDSNVFYTNVGAPITFFNNVAISGSLTMAPNNPIIADAAVFGNVNTAQIFSNTGETQIVTALRLSGRVKSDIQTVNINSNTASVDFGGSQMAVLALPSTGDTHIAASNINDGQVMNLLIKTTSGNATVSFAPSILQPSGSTYIATTSTGKDILSLSSFDNSSTSQVYLTNVTKFE